MENTKMTEQTSTDNTNSTYKKFNYGRFDWKATFPTIDEVRNATDEQLIKYYRFLPPAQNNFEKGKVLRHVVYEVKRRFLQQR
jgi:hypothetical protein